MPPVYRNDPIVSFQFWGEKVESSKLKGWSKKSGILVWKRCSVGTYPSTPPVLRKSGM
jgi:hypothetical protein